MQYIVTKLVSKLVLPPGLFILLLVVALLSFILNKTNYYYRSQKSKVTPLLLVVLIVVIYFFSSYLGELALVAPLEETYAPLEVEQLSLEPTTSIIVVLGGGMIRGTPQGAKLGRATLQRVNYGAQLQQKTDLDLAVSGGVGPGVEGPPGATVMKEFLVARGISEGQIITDKKALTTWLNAVNITKILNKKDYHKIILVTSATHMRRAVDSFRKNWSGEIVVAPTDYILSSQVSSLRWLPNRTSLHNTLQSLHEWVGLVWYQFKS
ncbi:YdcF family protein [Halanaerobaculum tunisiense]